MSSDREPWWASGDDPADAGTEDPFDAHARARAGWREELAEDLAAASDDEPDERPDLPHWFGDAVGLFGRMAMDATQRLSAGGGAADTHGGGAAGDPLHDHPAGSGRGAAGRRPRRSGGGAGPPHPPGEVCDACPFCLGLRALRQVRPEVIAHLSDATHHLSLALRAIADAAADGAEDVEEIPLDE